MECTRLTLDANNFVQMHERESRIKVPTSIHGYQNHPLAIQTMQTMVDMLHRVSKVNCLEPNGRECRAPLHEEYPQHHGHKGDPGVTPGTCGTIGERAQVVLV
jgi:hypothetical protein